MPGTLCGSFGHQHEWIRAVLENAYLSGRAEIGQSVAVRGPDGSCDRGRVVYDPRRGRTAFVHCVPGCPDEKTLSGTGVKRAWFTRGAGMRMCRIGASEGPSGVVQRRWLPDFSFA
ncbi:hypothetical protein GCM10010452_49810 [Crossiella cryophila]